MGLPGTPSHHGFQYEHGQNGLLTWMIWGSPILGHPLYNPIYPIYRSYQ